MQLVLADPPSEPEDVSRRAKSSALPPDFASTDNYLAHLSQKYGLKFMTRPRVVIATLASSTSDPTPGSTFIQGRIKRTARKKVPPPPRG